MAEFNYNYNELTEELLFQRYCQGDIKAFDTLLARLKGLVYSMILRYHKDEALADEIFQEVFLKVCRYKDQFREAISFKSWLVTICRNTCIDYSRRFKRSGVTVPLDFAGDGTERPLAEILPGDGLSPLEEVSFKLEDEDLKLLLEELPSAQRETFYMKIAADLTFEEIGRAMNCSTNTAKSRYRYALATLRGLVKRQRFLRRAVGGEA